MTINAHSAQLEATVAARVAAYMTPEAIAADQATARERRARWAAEGEAPVKPTTVRTAPAVRPASEASIAFLVRLTIERTPDVDPALVEGIVRDAAITMGQLGVSTKIDEMKAKPVSARPVTRETTTSRPEVPAGRYAVENEEGDLRFYKVDRPTEGRWAGYVFVKVQASDEEYNVRGRAASDAILARILAAGVEAAAVRYGVELQHCYACGRALTDALSRELGIGPDCRSK